MNKYNRPKSAHTLTCNDDGENVRRTYLMIKDKNHGIKSPWDNIWPFSSINYGMDTSPEARMVIKNLLLATEAGLGNGETPIFPWIWMGAFCGITRTMV